MRDNEARFVCRLDDRGIVSRANFLAINRQLRHGPSLVTLSRRPNDLFDHLDILKNFVIPKS